MTDYRKLVEDLRSPNVFSRAVMLRAADALEATLPTDDEREALVDRIADEVEYREVQAGRARVVELARRSPAPPVTEETEWVAEHIETGTRYVEVDWETEGTGYVRVSTGRSAYIVRAKKLRRRPTPEGSETA